MGSSVGVFQSGLLSLLQVLLEKKFTMSSDVWSYGMVMHEIWSLGSCPYPELSDLRDVSLHVGTDMPLLFIASHQCKCCLSHRW